MMPLRLQDVMPQEQPGNQEPVRRAFAPETQEQDPEAQRALKQKAIQAAMVKLAQDSEMMQAGWRSK